MRKDQKSSQVAALAGVMTMGMLAGCGEKIRWNSDSCYSKRNRYSNGSIKHYGSPEPGTGRGNVCKPYGRWTGRISHLGNPRQKAAEPMENRL